MGMVRRLWGWVQKHPGQAVGYGSAIAAAGGYTVAPWVHDLAGALYQVFGG